MEHNIARLADRAARLMKTCLPAPKAVNKLYVSIYCFNWAEWRKVRQMILSELGRRGNLAQSSLAETPHTQRSARRKAVRRARPPRR